LRSRQSLSATFTTLLVSVFLFLLTSEAWSVTLYSVRPRDTIAKIARSNGVTVERILRANPELGQNMNLKIGQIIVIPDREEIVVKDGEEEAPPAAVVLKQVSLVPTRSVVEVAAEPNRPSPLPTPVAHDDAVLPAAPTRVDQVAVVNDQQIQLPNDHHRPQLASRRGRILTKITAMARRFIGVPYVWGGTTARGYDCSGFTQRMYALAGVSIKRLADDQYYQGNAVDAPMPGDLVFFTTYLPGPSHVGIYLGDNLFIHASSRKGVTITSLGDPYFKRRYLGARRFF